MTYEKAKLKGIILAAGLGTRLRPLTEHVPKPLIRVCGVPLLFLSLWKMKKAGIDHVGINGHYKSEKILDFLKNLDQNQLPSWKFFHEPNLLGTAGVYQNMKEWIGESDLLVINSDILSVWDEKFFLDSFFSQKIKCLFLLRNSLESDKNLMWGKRKKKESSDFFEILSIGQEKKKNCFGFGFQGIQIFQNQIIDSIPPSGLSEIIPIYQKLIKNGENFFGLLSHEFFFDMGSPLTYWAGSLALLHGGLSLFDKLGLLSYQDFLKSWILDGSVLCHHTVTIQKNSVVGPYTICDEQVSIGSFAYVSYSVLLPHAVIFDHETVIGCLVGPDFRLSLL